MSKFLRQELLSPIPDAISVRTYELKEASLILSSHRPVAKPVAINETSFTSESGVAKIHPTEEPTKGDIISEARKVVDDARAA